MRRNKFGVNDNYNFVVFAKQQNISPNEQKSLTVCDATEIIYEHNISGHNIPTITKMNNNDKLL